jgi:hypothetical protein
MERRGDRRIECGMHNHCNPNPNFGRLPPLNQDQDQKTYIHVLLERVFLLQRLQRIRETVPTPKLENVRAQSISNNEVQSCCQCMTTEPPPGSQTRCVPFNTTTLLL